MISSKVLYTEEIDDLEAAAEELTGQASGFELGSSTVGIMFMDVDTEYEELYDNLKEKWTFPLVAATAIGMLTGQGGYAKGGISVMLLTSSDCKFAVGMTEGLTVANHVEVITKTYNELEKELGEEAKLVLTYGAKAAELIRDKDFGKLVVMLNGEVTAIPLEETAGKLKYVNVDNQAIQEAKTLGICFGD